MRELTPYFTKIHALQKAMHLIEWDSETLAPENSFEMTARINSVLAGEYKKAVTDPEYRKLLEKLKKEENLPKDDQDLIQLSLKMLKQIEDIPDALYKEYARLTGLASSVWQQAKKDNDYEKFKPALGQLIDITKEFCSYRGVKSSSKVYDLLLDDFEPETDMATLDEFFGQLKETIVPLLEEIKEKGRKIPTDFLHKSCDIDKQKEFCEYLVRYQGFDFKRGVMAESEHPFTTSFHNHDVRITNHYYEFDVSNAIFSAIHEAGHAIFELNIEDKWTMTPAGTEISMGLHESQSRFYENLLGRSYAFWKPIYPRLQAIFPESFKEISLEEFVDANNVAKPGCIRTAADELTYPLHILIRYEMEMEIFKDNLSLDKLPEIWNEKYKEYLGVTPSNVSEGILQDIHWAGGSFGYFPSYALGSAFGSQMLHQMEKDLPVEEYLKDGKIAQINQYLGERIHRYGGLRGGEAVLREMTGEEFNPKYYLDYLTKKYRKLYDL